MVWRSARRVWEFLGAKANGFGFLKNRLVSDLAVDQLSQALSLNAIDGIEPIRQ